MGLPGKPNGMSGGDVEQYFSVGADSRDRRLCETDVVNTYRVWLRYELLRGRLRDAEFRTSEGNLFEFIKAHGNTKPQLAALALGGSAAAR
jgi:predicted PolB exonuclease-like 3'-5' exonuclease